VRILKNLIVLISLLPFSIAYAESYTLVTETHCKNRGVQFEFTCDTRNTSAPKKLTITRLPDNKWIGDEGGNKFTLEFIKEDNSVLVLNYPVLYSGISNVVLFKATGRFYLTEIGYSSVFNLESYDVDSGNFVVVK